MRITRVQYAITLLCIPGIQYNMYNSCIYYTTTTVCDAYHRSIYHNNNNNNL